MTRLPVYPLRVAFEDGDEWILDTPVEVACSLEWFDTEDGNQRTKVTDAQGQPVRVRVVAHDLQVCELIEPEA